ncbi:MAG: dehydratase [Gammaproteobacteria bacterium]|nr:dehydratase [Gammaproteobacteria bacterium]
MRQWNYKAAKVGDSLPALAIAPISRTTLALYAGASGDHNPIHIDIDAARQAGFNDVFSHGMLIMAYLGRALTNAIPQADLREFGVHFTAITHVHERLNCCARVAAVESLAEQEVLILSVEVSNSAGEIKLKGDAKIGRPRVATSA